MREMKRYQITEWCHHFMENHVEEGIFAKGYIPIEIYEKVKL